MVLACLKECTSCSRYSRDNRVGFSYHRFFGINTERDFGDAGSILFVMEGELEVSCGDEKQNVAAGNMVCLHRECLHKVVPQGEGGVIVMKFGDNLEGCERFSLSQLGGLGVSGEIGIHPLDIRERLKMFLSLMMGYMEDEVCCAPFHEVKVRELFHIMQFYYTKEEMAVFFRPLLGRDCKFRSIVLENCEDAMTVKELSESCGIPVSSFRRNFLKEFGEPASVWLQKQKNSMIERRLADENISIGDIAEELHFSSQSQFCRYCKKNFGYTPMEWRKRLKNKTVPTEGTL